MIAGRLYRREPRTLLLREVRRTTGTIERMRGLLGRPRLVPGEGLLLDPCRAVHTAGMRYPLDLAFLDRAWRIARLVVALPPWRVAACLGAVMTLELAPGSVAALGLNAGEVLEWEPVT